MLTNTKNTSPPDIPQEYLDNIKDANKQKDIVNKFQNIYEYWDDNHKKNFTELGREVNGYMLMCVTDFNIFLMLSDDLQQFEANIDIASLSKHELYRYLFTACTLGAEQIGNRILDDSKLGLEYISKDTLTKCLCLIASSGNVSWLERLLKQCGENDIPDKVYSVSRTSDFIKLREISQNLQQIDSRQNSIK